MEIEAVSEIQNGVHAWIRSFFFADSKRVIADTQVVFLSIESENPGYISLFFEETVSKVHVAFFLRGWVKFSTNCLNSEFVDGQRNLISFKSLLINTAVNPQTDNYVGFKPAKNIFKVLLECLEFLKRICFPGKEPAPGK